MSGYQITWWTHHASHMGSTSFVNSPLDLPTRIAEVVKEKPIRIEIVEDDGRGNVTVGENGVNGPGWRT